MKRNLDCKYRRECCDYSRNKELCHNKDWEYCKTFKRLNKRENDREERTK